MSFDPNNPFGIVKDGLIFAAIGKIFAYATDKAADFARDLPNNEEYEEYEEYD
tara:strand:+ start:308 stop:466 length:159 start_codon:yes stop_codon:yes gene_type:complete